MTEKRKILVDIFAAEVRESYGIPTHVVFRKFNCKTNEFYYFYRQTHLIDKEDLIMFSKVSDKVIPMKMEYKTKKIRSYLRYLYYKAYVYYFGGWCNYHSKKINSIKQCGVCSVCNWHWKCGHFNRYR